MLGLKKNYLKKKTLVDQRKFKKPKKNKEEKKEKKKKKRWLALC